ncbi:MAG TPA: hypothetical protein VFU47_10490, partial [Armatimonadota bacterium]|nr:hypothetical protein [Armatimonadota bacterium]
MQTVTSIFLTALIFGFCIPLYMAAQRQADAALVRARMAAVAREVAAHLREDIRQAARVEVG